MQNGVGSLRRWARKKGNRYAALGDAASPVLSIGDRYAASLIAGRRRQILAAINRGNQSRQSISAINRGNHPRQSISAAELGVAEHLVVKTLVMETDSREALLVLMHGDREVSTKELARAIGARSVTVCDPALAQKLTGYLVGGTSPLGTRKELPVYAEKTIFELPMIYINGGKRGFLVSIQPAVLRRALKITEVSVAIA